ncbi:hypothetical protein Asi02nite_30900 [Asanoa siamensis]|uniref:Lanthionine synthetase-like protein n=1 Tax=Asanoa siamensis TaxID=926357 RepID=A0ABQ4CQP5_9ACTN|nr:hypothetical protein Asi02nite_30900 [Asanoa siamensis]
MHLGANPLGLLNPAKSARAAALGMDVAASVVSPERLEAGVAALHAQTVFSVARWHPASLALGDAGAAAVCAVLDQRSPAAGWDRVGHQFLSNAVASLSDPQVLLSLFSGICGAASAVWMLSRGGRRYRGLRARLDSRVLPLIHESEFEFDAIHGMSGWVAYLTFRDAEPECAAALRTAATALATQTRDSSADAGLAHGLAGPLAALALARSRSDVELPVVDAAIHRIADRLSATARVDDVSLAWCSGAPGVARALWLAGEALDDDRYRGKGIDLAIASLRPPIDDSTYPTPTFCHGIAGHLLATSLFWWDTAHPAFRDGAQHLCDLLLARHAPDTLFGYQDWEQGGSPVDNPGLLCGAAGVALVLLALAADRPPAWSRLFLLA